MRSFVIAATIAVLVLAAAMPSWAPPPILGGGSLHVAPKGSYQAPLQDRQALQEAGWPRGSPRQDG